MRTIADVCMSLRTAGAFTCSVQMLSSLSSSPHLFVSCYINIINICYICIQMLSSLSSSPHLFVSSIITQDVSEAAAPTPSKPPPLPLPSEDTQGSTANGLNGHSNGAVANGTAAENMRTREPSLGFLLQPASSVTVDSLQTLPLNGTPQQQQGVTHPVANGGVFPSAPGSQQPIGFSGINSGLDPGVRG